MTNEVLNTTASNDLNSMLENLNPLIERKTDNVIDKIAHFLENGMDVLSVITETAVNTAIQHSSMPESAKAELIKNIDNAIVVATKSMKEEVEILDSKSKNFVNYELPKIEDFLKNIESKVEHFIKSKVLECEDNIHKLGDKIKHFMHIDNDMEFMYSANDLVLGGEINHSVNESLI